MIAAGLTEVNRAGLIHSDIKPANVLIRKSGDPALADFGHQPASTP
jgi:serine/threonine protein kinase